MKKENFICPCCGLPNHLEFKSKADYDNYLNGQHSSDKFKANPDNYQFNRYILEENEEESDGRKKEIENRFNLIKDYWNKYQNFEEWFGKEVVGFIPDKPDMWNKYPYYSYGITQIIKTLNENLNIYKRILVINNSLDIYKLTQVKVSEYSHLDDTKYNIQVTYNCDIDTIQIDDLTLQVKVYRGGTIVENIAE